MTLDIDSNINIIDISVFGSVYWQEENDKCLQLFFFSYENGFGSILFIECVFLR